MHESTLLLSVGQVAQLFGVCTKTIRRWCKTGRLKVHLRTAGQHRRFRLADLEPLLLPYLKINVKSLVMLVSRVMIRKVTWSHNHNDYLIGAVKRLFRI